MKKLLLFLALFITTTVMSQDVLPTKPSYVTASFSYYNGGGTFSQQGSATLEVGKYLQDDFTLGLATGITAFSKGKPFLEIRPTFYYTSNKFSQGFTLGGGYVFELPTHYLLEWSTSTNFSVTDRVGVGIFIGGYNFNGKLLAAEYSFAGVSITYIFKK